MEISASLDAKRSTVSSSYVCLMFRAQQVVNSCFLQLFNENGGTRESQTVRLWAKQLYSSFIMQFDGDNSNWNL